MKITGASVNDLLWYPHLAAQDFARLKDLGLTMARLDVPWAKHQPDQRKPIDFSNLDTVLGAAHDAGVDMLLVLDLPRPNYWAGPFNQKIGTNAQFADFGAAIARRYPQVTHFEIGNEVNAAPMWAKKINDVGVALWGALTGSIDPAAYTSWLKVMTPALKSANPAARVCFAGMAACIDFRKFFWMPLSSATGTGFLASCIKAGLADADYDAVGYHPYPLNDDWQSFAPVGDAASGNVHKQLTEMERIHALVPNKPIWATEWGFATSDYTVPSVRAGQFAAEWAYLSTLGYVEINVIHALRDYAYLNQPFNIKDREATYGLINVDFSDKPIASWVQTVNGS